jgi:integrase
LPNLCFSLPIRGPHFGSFVGIAAASSLPELRLRSDTSKRNDFIQSQGRNDSITNLSEVQPKGRAIEHPGESVDMTFAELNRRWEEAVVPTIKATTASYYRKILRAHLKPHFGQQQISAIGRYEVERFLAGQAKEYSRNTLRGMRVSLGRVLSWAVECGWLETNPCSGVRLPRAGRRIVRTVLKPDQGVAIAQRLPEPYATLVLFLAITSLRIGEAIGIKWSDFEVDVLHICRRIYEGRADTTKTEGSNRSLPIPATLLTRMRSLGGQEWVFRSRENTPVNPGNALKRYVRPVAEALGIPLGGWHDLRHTLTTGLLRSGVSPKVVSKILGHSDVQITLNVYDHPEIENFREPLAAVADQLLRDVTKSDVGGAVSN